jgi:hypothetical protein
MKSKCWLIGRPDGSWSSLLQAVSRGVEIESCGDGALRNIPEARGTLIAIDFHRLATLPPHAQSNLSEQINAGATCYVGGGLPAGAHYSLDHLAPVDFRVAHEDESSGYMFTAQPLLPDALRGESVDGAYNIPVARGLSTLAQPLTVVRARNGSAAPSLFAIHRGQGVIICDLSGGGHNADATNRKSILSLLEDTATRPLIIGPLIAFNRAAGRDPARPVGCNIVIDDRPANLDYFNTQALRRFLHHLADRCPGVHVDFGWTPDQTRPSGRYVETLKQFNAGFVWHGLLHHTDHRTVTNPELHFAYGRRLVNEISERYQVRFQPVMVFPYEKDTDDCVQLLMREGFIAKAETPAEITAAAAENMEPGINRPISGLSDHVDGGFVVLARASVETLSRDRMLARAALGMPIIAAAHPKDACLRRFGKMRPSSGAIAEFDRILDFIAAKSLRPASLEELARETLAAGI